MSTFKRSISDAIAAVVDIPSSLKLSTLGLHSTPGPKYIKNANWTLASILSQHWHPTGTCPQPIIYSLFTNTRVASNNKLHREVQQHHGDQTHRWWGQRGLQDQGGQPGVMV